MRRQDIKTCEITMPPGGTSIVAVFAPIH